MIQERIKEETQFKPEETLDKIKWILLEPDVNEDVIVPNEIKGQPINLMRKEKNKQRNKEANSLVSQRKRNAVVLLE